MSPKAPDPRVRTALIDEAAKLLIEHGPDALTTRRLAAAVGTSTMAVYTYFRGMHDLRWAVAREGFDRLARYLEAIERTDDTVADLGALGGAYCRNAVVNPHLYRFMFLERPPGEKVEVGIETFERLVDGVARAIEAGRFKDGDPWELATQLWAATHGIITLHLSGLLTLEDAMRTLEDIALNLFVAFGDEREAASESMKKALTRILAGVGDDFVDSREVESTSP
jgi:AcrR family transcriptional regulator